MGVVDRSFRPLCTSRNQHHKGFQDTQVSGRYHTLEYMRCLPDTAMDRVTSVIHASYIDSRMQCPALTSLCAQACLLVLA